MTIKVNLESTLIPVEIGEMTFQIDVADDKYSAFLQKFNQFLKKAEAFDETKKEEVTKIKTAVKNCYNALLGESAFDNIYEQMPNLIFMIHTLKQIMVALSELVEGKLIEKTDF